MTVYEYKVVPAPAKGEKARGVKGAEARFAYALERVMNEMAEGGWEFQRSETLPAEERTGLTQTTTQWRNLLVFRRARQDDISDFRPRLLEKPATPPASLAPMPDISDPADDGPAEAPQDVTAISPVLKARASQVNRKPDPPDDVAAE
ncbi:DUF4177 domain-containing protein [Mesobacterium sp. TK19101]|uniref:DUF4177 domain-containing protein n=1 Tax=Mesobacterium hydrothermale TaxID=3111907 RepID=A0ABU6HHI0_9RHOB|nr:DUF4177 domain-containing protein [Mesobacterium sp. TK19101]MEC3861917.1 DUF4177 domain-containing protein [Mesobacterium sp. TK19101]